MMSNYSIEYYENTRKIYGNVYKDGTRVSELDANKRGKLLGMEMEVALMRKPRGYNKNVDTLLPYLRDIHSDTTAGGRYSPEIVTRKLTKEEMYEVLPLLAKIGRHNVKNNYRAGVHIHISHEWYKDSSHLERMAYLFFKHPIVGRKIGYRPASGFNSDISELHTVLSRKGPFRNNIKGTNSRYLFRSVTPYGTSEFRMFNTTGSVTQLKRYIDDIFYLLEYTEKASFSDIDKLKGFKRSILKRKHMKGFK